MLVLMFWVYIEFFAPEPPKPQETETVEEAITDDPVKTPDSTIEEAESIEEAPDSIMLAERSAQLGAFAAGAEGSEKFIVIENEDVRITFSTLGGSIKEVLLKEYLTYTKEPLILSDEENLQISKLISSQGKQVDLKDLYFTTNARSAQVENGDTLEIKFRLPLEAGGSVEQTYKIAGTGYLIDYNLNFDGLDNIVDNQDMTFFWNNHAKRMEANLEDARRETWVQWRTLKDEVDDISSTDPDLLQEATLDGVKWASLKQKFFTSAILSDNGFRSGEFTSIYNPLDTSIVREATFKLTYPIGDLKTGQGDFSFYFGPNSYQILKKMPDGFSANVDLGWNVFAVINKFLVIPLFSWLENYISNYGIIIMILVIVIKIILFPLSYKAYMSMAKMKAFKPELDEMKEKYPDDMQKQQSEMMAMYQKAGVNPLSGCIPMLLQMPILFALFNFFPNSIELRQQSFLWAHDLSTYDSVLDLPFNIPMYGDHVSLFTILMTLSTILYTWSNSQMTTVQGPMKTMQYIMPVMFMFFLNSFSAGLTFYYFVANIVTFGQQFAIKQFIDEDKIRKLIEENKLKNANKKQSPFMSKLQNAMKQAEEQRREKQKKKK